MALLVDNKLLEVADAILNGVTVDNTLLEVADAILNGVTC